LRVDDLKIILDLLRYQSFSKVAEMHFMTQSAVTKRVQAVENYFGGVIFTRSPAGFGKLTSFGEDILPFIKSAGKSIEEAERKSRLLARELRIEISTGFRKDMILSLLDYFKEAGTKLKVDISNSKEIYSSVREHETDMGIIGYSASIPGVYSYKLYSEDIVLVGSKKLPSFKLEKIYEIPLILQQQGSGLREFVIRNLSDRGINPGNLNIVMSCGFESFTLEACLKGYGYTFLPSSAIQGKGLIRIGEEAETTMSRSFSFICRDEKMGESVQKFMKARFCSKEMTQ